MLQVYSNLYDLNFTHSMLLSSHYVQPKYSRFIKDDGDVGIINGTRQTHYKISRKHADQSSSTNNYKYLRICTLPLSLASLQHSTLWYGLKSSQTVPNSKSEQIGKRLRHRNYRSKIYTMPFLSTYSRDQHSRVVSIFQFMCSSQFFYMSVLNEFHSLWTNFPRHAITRKSSKILYSLSYGCFTGVGKACSLQEFGV